MRRRKQNLSSISMPTRLEERRLLAGDVQVVVIDRILNFIGDAESNLIEVSRQDDGSLLVTGDDTTINGSANAFTVTDSFQKISLFMRAGDDDVLLNGVQVSQNLSFYGDEGNGEEKGS